MDLTINSKQRDSVGSTIKIEKLDNITASSGSFVQDLKSSALKIQVKQEPTDQTQSEISKDGYDTVMIKKKPPLSDSGRVKERRGSVRVQSPSSEECNEGRVVTLSTDDVAQHDEPVAQPKSLFQDDNIDQSDESLHIKQVSSVKRSTEAPPEIPQNSREGSKTFTCGECKKQFNYKNQTRHKRIHTGERPFECEICNALFSQSSHLKVHRRIHSGEKPYKCEEKGCNAAFSDASNWRRHRRSHSGEKPFQCKHCNTSFSQGGSLRSHQRIHSGEKPYKCKEKGCNAAFTQSGSLRAHQRTHSGKPFQCCYQERKYFETDPLL